MALCCLGLLFSLTSAIGIVRMPDVYTRIQCSTMTVTMGALPVLIGIAVEAGPVSTYGSRALLVGVLLLVVSPAASHALARAAYKTDIPMWPGAVRDEPRRRRAERGEGSGP